MMKKAVLFSVLLQKERNAARTTDHFRRLEI
jgi:hypothetical protein